MVPLSDEDAQALTSAWREVTKRFTGDIVQAWRDLDVTLPQMKILLRLCLHGPIRVGALAEDVGVSPSTVTAIVRRLVRQGLVERRDDPGDRRVVLNLLSTKGEMLMRQLGYRGDEDFLRAIATLFPEERAELLYLLHRLSVAFDESLQGSRGANSLPSDAGS